MSEKERQEFEDRIAAFEKKTRPIVRLWPYATGLFGFVVGIVSTTVWVKNWDATLVKQPQFQSFELRAIKSDSTLNAKVDTVEVRINKRVDDLTRVN